MLGSMMGGAHLNMKTKISNIPLITLAALALL